MMQTSTTYKKVASYEAKKGEVNKCVLLYSGGLDTSCMLKWIQDEYQCQVIALTLDVGQQADDLEEIKSKSFGSRASLNLVLKQKMRIQT
jgi:argininosuccinate synthase